MEKNEIKKNEIKKIEIKKIEIKKIEMEEKEFDLKLKDVFANEEELPEVVRRRTEEAYEIIRARGRQGENRKMRQKGWGMLPKAAGIVLALVLVLGGSAIATSAILNRYERMKNMGEEEVEQLQNDIEHSENLSFQFSRELTEEERRRLQVMRTAYKYDEAFPEKELERLPEGETYSGEGVLLYVSPKGMENLVYLPDRTLTDEELLEIVEYDAKYSFVLYDKREETFAESGQWAKKLTELTDEDIDYYYLAAFSSHFEVSDGYCRIVDGVLDTELDKPGRLSEKEEKLYKKLEAAYLADEAFPQWEIKVIENSEDYTGIGVALCRYDAYFYLPEEELTEEEILEIIDFRKKADYAANRIADDIQLGKRSGYPRSTEE